MNWITIPAEDGYKTHFFAGLHSICEMAGISDSVDGSLYEYCRCEICRKILKSKRHSDIKESLNRINSADEQWKDKFGIGILESFRNYIAGNDGEVHLVDFEKIVVTEFPELEGLDEFVAAMMVSHGMARISGDKIVALETVPVGRIQ